MGKYYVVNLKRGAYIAKAGKPESLIISKKTARNVCKERNLILKQKEVR